MAIAPMQKVMIVAHRSQAGQVISALQDAGIIEILNAERAMVSKEWPELEMDTKRPKDTEELVARLDKAIVFLKQFGTQKDGRSALRPLIEVNKKAYTEIVLGSSALILLDKAERAQTAIDKFQSHLETLRTEIQKLLPWKDLQTPIEHFGTLETAACFIGILPRQHFESATQKVTEFQAAVQPVGGSVTTQPCLVFCMKEVAQDVQKTLRSCEFEPASFEGLKGTIADNIAERESKIAEIERELTTANQTAAEIAAERLKLEILADHYHNFLIRKQTQSTAPATDSTIFFEGWIKKKDYPHLVKLLEPFDGTDVAIIEPAEGEEVPVEIENAKYIRPFETVTRLYGMPIPSSIDPTVFLAPFFAIFFGLCMADGGYGLILVAILAWAVWKAQGDKKMLWMLLVCGITTTLAGAITGSWFGDAITSLLPEGNALRNVLDGIRVKLMLFDPMTQPMTFFLLSLGIGYFQIQFGLFIALFANLAKKDVAAAIWDQLTWIIHLNALLCLGLAKGGMLPATLGKPCGIIAIFTSLAILLFTARGVAWGGRIGLGVYQLFSTVFYMGDVLSYARLMALGMVGSGFGMAINVLVKLVVDVPYVGWLLGALVFIGGHLFNVALSILGAFVHTMRLQFVEFFPKFFVGGGRDFIPLRKEYKHIQVK
ncbi:MAG: V-type ATP synthase subunit I [Anaerohalosphaeraceae bacterium]